MFKGSLVALVTPFDRQNRIDYPALERLIEFHVREGSNGLVIAGTTGESATLEKSEHVELIERAVEMVAGRIRRHFARCLDRGGRHRTTDQDAKFVA